MKLSKLVKTGAGIVFALSIAAGFSRLLRADVPQVQTGQWSTVATFGEISAGAASVALPDGRLLVAGGSGAGGSQTARISIYNPVTGTWTSGGRMLERRAGHTASVLQDGRVVIAGGMTGNALSGSIEIYDSFSGVSALAGTLVTARADHAAATLKDGTILIAGGSSAGGPLASVEVFDPATGHTNVLPAQMSVARTGLSATSMLDGHVLVAGGNDGAHDLKTAEVYDYKARTFSATASMSVARRGHLAILLPSNNHVLIAGGTSEGQALGSAEAYADWNHAFESTPNPMSAARVGAIGGGLKKYDAAIVGGGGPASAEYFGFATVKTDKDDYWPGEIVHITGSGWQPGETVTLKISEDADTHEDFTTSAVADASGNISNTTFTPQNTDTDHDLGVTFYLNATGAASQAQNTFTDGEILESYLNKKDQWGGTLQSSNSIFRENDLIPTRFQMTGLTPGTTYTVVLKNDFALATTSFVHFVDWMGSVPATSNGVAVDPCAGIGVNCGIANASNIHAIPFPVDDIIAPGWGLPAGDQQAGNLKIYGASSAQFTLQTTNASHICGNGSVGSQAFYCVGDQTGVWKDVQLTFTATDTSAVLAYGAHLSTEADFGAGNGASSFSGGSGKLYAVFGANAAKNVGIQSSAIVISAVTTTTPSGNPNPSAASASVAVSATVTGSSPTGSVAFYDITGIATASCSNLTGATTMGTGTVSSGVATINYSGWVAASAGRLVLACYSGDTTNQASEGTYTQVVNTATATFTTVSPVTGIYGGTSSSISATLKVGAAALPGKAVTFFLNGTQLAGTATTDAAGIATYGPTSLGTINASATPYGSVSTPSSCAAVTAGVCAAFAGDAGNSPAAATNTLTVSTKAATIASNPKTKVYGDVNPALDATVTGTVNGDILNYTLSTTATQFSNAGGTYPITATLGSNPNYTITRVNSVLTITAKSVGVSVTANAKSKAYGDVNPALDAVVAGTVNGDVLNYTLATTAQQFSNVGGYPITVTLGSNPNYVVAKTDSTLTITAKSAGVSVTANPKTKTYGDVNPALDATVTGTVNGDVLNYTLATGAQQFSGIGGYPITVTLGSNPNYTVAKTDSTLTVGVRNAAVAANPKTKTYGDVNPALTATVTGTVNGDALNYSLATTAVQLSNIGGYPIAVTLGSNPNYNVAPTNSTLTIGAKGATITAADAGKTYGAADPVFAVSQTGFLAGDLAGITLSATRAAGEAVGGYAITPLAAGGNIGNYTVTPTAGTFTISAAVVTVRPSGPLTLADAKGLHTARFGATTGVTTGVTGALADGDKGLALAGTNGKATFAALPLNGSYSIEFWINPVSNGGWQTVIANAATGVGIYLNPDMTLAAYGNHQVWSAPLTGGALHHVVFVADGANGTFYINGVAQGSSAWSDAGGDAITVNALFNDDFADVVQATLVDDISIHSGTALSAGDVATHYALRTDTGTAYRDAVLASATTYWRLNDDTSKVTLTYGDATPAFTPAYSGFVNGDTASVLTTAATCSTTFTPLSNAGSAQTAACAGAAAANYSFAYPVSAVTVDKAMLIVTASSPSVTYGDPVPTIAPIYNGFLNEDGPSVVTTPPVCTTTYTSTSPVGSSPKTSCSGGASTNYALTHASGSVTVGGAGGGGGTECTTCGNVVILPKHLTVTADPGSRQFGLANPPFTGTVSGFVNGETEVTANLSGAALCSSTANLTTAVGVYGPATAQAITCAQGSLAAPNYDFPSGNFVNGTLTITGRAITVTADAGQSKVYGAANPASYTYAITSGGPLGAGDSFTGALSRAAGETVGTYAITQGNLALNTNYTLTFVSTDFAITAKGVTVGTTGGTKAYGSADPNPIASADLSGFLAGDGIGATFARAAGETAGPYHVTTTLTDPGSKLSNYTVTNAGGTFTITPKIITVDTDGGTSPAGAGGSATKTYGSADPSPLATANLTGFLPADGIGATFTRAPGELVGSYAITTTLTDPLNKLSNYTVTNSGGTFTITAKAVTVGTTSAGKTYGSADPAPLATADLSGFLAADGIGATFTRAPGELAGSYHITTTLTDPNNKLGNYTVTNTGGTFTITAKGVTVGTTGGSKTYGAADPNPLATADLSSFLAADGIGATFARAAGETAGPYHVTTTLTDPNGKLSNYTVTNAGGTFTITPKTITVVTNGGAAGSGAPGSASKTYGSPDPDPLATATLTGFLPEDGISATFTREPGEQVGSYAITTTLTDPNNKLSNYAVTNSGGTFTITAKSVTVGTGAAGKVYGAADPAPLTTADLTGFLAADGIGATFARAAGEDAGPYHITTTLTDPNSKLSNYAVTNAGGTFTIGPKPITVGTDGGSAPAGAAGSGTKAYGSADPSPLATADLAGFLAADGIGATFTRAPGELVGSYHITTTLTDPNGKLGNYTVTNTGGTFTITAKAVTVATSAAGKTFGAADPNPLTTANLSGFLAGDGIGATFARAAGQTVGAYHITTTLTDPNGKLSNYTVTNAGATFTIDAASPSLTTTGGTFTYDGNAHASTGRALGIDGNPVPGTFSIVYAPGGANPPVNAADQPYGVTATFTSSDANYRSGGTATNTIKINKAGVTLTLSGDGTFPYNGQSHAVTAKVTGTAQDVPVSYSGSCGAAPVNVVDTPCTATANYAGDANHAAASSSGTITITAIAPTLQATGGSFVYDGTPHAASGSATGLNGAGVSGSFSFVYAPSGTAPIDASPVPYDATGTFTSDNQNYTSGGTAATTITIAQATQNFVDLSVPSDLTYGETGFAVGSGGSGTGSFGYDYGYGIPLGEFLVASGSAKGQRVTPTSSALRVRLGSQHTSAIIVSPSTGCTVDSVSGLIVVTNASGTCIVATTKAGDTNYLPQTSAPKTITLHRAEVLVAAAGSVEAEGGVFPYDGLPHPGSGSAKGINNENLTPIVLTYTGTGSTVYGPNSSVAPVNVGTYLLTASYAGNDNYLPGTATAPITITAKAATITAQNNGKIYGDDEPTLTATQSGFLPGDVAGITLGGTRAPGEDVGTYAITPFATGGNVGNYTLTKVNGTFTIAACQAGPAAGTTVYTGSSYFWTTSATSSTSTLTLTATIAGQCGSRSDITTARVTFGTMSGNRFTPLPSAQNLRVGLVDPSNKRVGTASAIVQYNIGKANTENVTIGILVNGNFTLFSNPDQAVVTISKPGSGSSIVTVDGTMDGVNASGYLGGSSKVVGAVAYNKGGTNPKGSFTATVTSLNKPDGTFDNGVVHTYVITSNAISELTFPKPGASASFGGKCTVTDITDPDAPVSLDGGATFQFVFYNNDGASTQTASLSVTAKSSGKTWFSSSWDGARTIQKLFTGLLSSQ